MSHTLKLPPCLFTHEKKHVEADLVFDHVTRNAVSKYIDVFWHDWCVWVMYKLLTLGIHTPITVIVHALYKDIKQVSMASWQQSWMCKQYFIQFSRSTCVPLCNASSTSITMCAIRRSYAQIDAVIRALTSCASLRPCAPMRVYACVHARISGYFWVVGTVPRRLYIPAPLPLCCNYPV